MKKIIPLFFLFSIFNSWADDDFCKDFEANCKCEKNGDFEICKSYHENGNLEFEVYLKNGKFNGIVSRYKENGKLDFVMNYLDDEINGFMLGFDENGDFEFFANLVNGKEEGISINYKKDKNEIWLSEYENGKFLRLKKFSQTKEVNMELINKLKIEKMKKQKNQ